MKKPQTALPRTIEKLLQSKQFEVYPHYCDAMQRIAYTRDEWESDRAKHIKSLQAALQLAQRMSNE